MTQINTIGLYKSGSTFIYNLVRRIQRDFPDAHISNVRKLHTEWERSTTPNHKIIYTYRDIRDSLASTMRKFSLTLETFQAHQKISPIDWLERNVKLDTELKNYPHKDTMLVLRYEDDILDHTIAINKCLDFFNVKPYMELLDKYYRHFDLSNTKKFTDQIEVYDNDTRYFYNHIGDGKTSFKTYFDESFYGNNKLITDWLELNNYN